MNFSPYEKRYRQLRQLIDHRLRVLVKPGKADELTDACRYVLAGGGKRLRAALVMLSCEAVGGKVRDALDAAAAVELMHNFTLVHDDIMDNAQSRRGRPTVHARWDRNNALLVGDVILGMAYQSLQKSHTKRIGPLVELFTRGLLGVCEGQALDLEYEHRADVTLREYFSMIDLKTGRLLATACEIGGCLGDGTAAEREALRRFGQYLGRAFQLQDDLLDVVANQKQFGKTTGGDIIEGKKTFLLLKAVSLTQGKDRRILQEVLQRHQHRKSDVRHHEDRISGKVRERTITAVTAVYRRYGVLEEAQHLVRKNTEAALRLLRILRANNATGTLRWLSEALMNRTS